LKSPDVQRWDLVHPDLRQNLIDLTYQLLNYCQTERDAENGKIFNGGSILQERHPTEFDKAINSISKISYVKDYIPTYIIKEQYRSFLNDIVRDGDLTKEIIAERIDDLLNRLKERIQDFEAILPLENVSLEGVDQIKIGNVYILSPTIVNDKLNKYSIKYHLMEMFNHPSFQDKVCACISVTSDAQVVSEKALIKIENILNILRLYTPLFLEADSIRIGVSGSVLTSRSNIIFLGKNGWQASSRRLGPSTPFKITREFITTLREKYQLGEIESILSKEEKSLTKFESQILLAIRWIGMALNDEIDSDKFIKLIIALETLLLKRDDDPKSKSLAERSAYILGKDQKSRLDMYDRMKMFYIIRSNIVHDGEIFIDEVKVQDLRDITIKILLKLLKMRVEEHFNEVNDLTEWVDQQIADRRFIDIPPKPAT
jgi:hypothetical protein